LKNTLCLNLKNTLCLNFSNTLGLKFFRSSTTSQLSFLRARRRQTSPATTQIRSTEHISHKFNPPYNLYHQKSDWWTDAQTAWKTQHLPSVNGSVLKEMWHHQPGVS
jgi:hypothetical protein